MIHFYDDLVVKTLKTIEEAYDCADVLNDLEHINQAAQNVTSCGNWLAADQLDREMRQKYPCIDKMVAFANSIPIPVPRVKKTFSPSEAALSNLKQDYYGIICDTAIKKQIIPGIEDFIKSVD